jgi:hypothetical protein
LLLVVDHRQASNRSIWRALCWEATAREKWTIVLTMVVAMVIS